MSLRLVKNIILVASGKGGVGKSTVASLIALQLSSLGNKVGLMDADISGPSIPTIFDIEDSLPGMVDDEFEPVFYSDISIMSIGFLVKKDSALAWRGPILSKSLNQLLLTTAWGFLDYLIIDTPPGTGDIHISIAQKCKNASVIIVSTPDKIALQDVGRAIDFYQKLDLKILGIVENMSFIRNDNQNIQLFGGDLSKFASSKKLNILAKLPLIPNLSDSFENYYSNELKINFDF